MAVRVGVYLQGWKLGELELDEAPAGMPAELWPPRCTQEAALVLVEAPTDDRVRQVVHIRGLLEPL